MGTDQIRDRTRQVTSSRWIGFCRLVLLAAIGVGPAGCAIRLPEVRPEAPAPTAGQPVRVWTEQITLPTYAVHQDPVPRFQATDEAKFYPYPAQRDIAAEASPRPWTVVCLENRYLKVMIMPEQGGRVFALYDKLAGADIVYRQPSVKPAKAAIRGAWTSGGIEFNFPDSHSVTTHDKVHWTTRQYPDGTAAVLIGDVERISRMAWTVELRLSPDRACLEDRIVLHNRTPMRQRYYYWTNAGVEASDQTQILFPFPKVTGHFGGGGQDWPIRDGIDYSWYRRHPDATSLFAVGGQECFIGAYDHGTGVGVAHYADRRQLPGRKFWSWGTSPAGRRWYEVLSDDKRPYLELQSGPMLTQSDYAWMQPYEVQRYAEYWIPVSRIGPFARANPDAVVRLSVEAGEATVGVLPLRPFPAARVELRADGRVLQTWNADLTPEQPLLQTRKTDGADAASLRLIVRDAQGRTVIEHAHGKYALEGGAPEPLANTSPSRGDATTPAGAANRYERYWLNTEYADAARTLEEALSKWPDDPQVRFDGGLFRLFQGRPAEAIELLQPLVEGGDAKDLQAKYYLALANLRAGHPQAAQRLLVEVEQQGANAADAPVWTRAARILLAKVLMSENRHSEAFALLEPIRETDPDCTCTYAGALRGCAARRNDAGLLIEPWLYQPDLEPMTRLEAQLLTGQTDPTLQRMLLRDPEVAIELACDYISVGDWSTAEAVLVGSCGKIIESGMTWLLASYCAAQQGKLDKAADYRAKAAQAPIDRVFPSRLEELAAAEHALQADPSTARAAYYAGLVLMRLMRYDEAIARWRQAIDARDDNPLARRCLAMALAQIKNDRQDAIAHLERAIRIEPRQPGFYQDLADLYSALGRVTDARDVLRRAMDSVPATDSLVMNLATTYLAGGQYREAAEALAGHRFNVAEGRYGVHDDYAIAWVGAALEALLNDEPREALAALDKALEYPENLSIGRPDNPQNESMIHFWRGVALGRLARPDQARQAFEQSVREASGDRALRRSFYGALNVVHGALALKVLGRTEELAGQIERLRTGPRSSRRWEQQFERFRSSAAFRAAWAQALQGDSPITAASLKVLADDPQVPAEWTRLSLLAAQALASAGAPGAPESVSGGGLTAD